MRSDLLSFLKYLLVQNVEKIFSKFFYLAKEGKVNMFVGNVLKKYITAIAGVYAISIGALFASEPIVIGLPLAQTGPVGVADHQDGDRIALPHAHPRLLLVLHGFHRRHRSGDHNVGELLRRWLGAVCRSD